MTEYSTYIFDLDGTLLSTLSDLAACTNYALRTNGFLNLITRDSKMPSLFASD